MSRRRPSLAVQAGVGLTAFYSRLTVEDRANGNMSLSNQRKRFVELADSSGWEPIQVYEEPKRVSGELGEEDRPGLAELLGEVRAGRVARVVVRHLDRLGRGAVLEQVFAVLREHSVAVHTFDGTVDLTSAAGRLGVRAQAMVGAFEVERAGERIREAKRRRSMDGWYLGPAPYGYSSQARLRAELTALYGDPDRARAEAQHRTPLSPGLVIDEVEAITVREIFRRFVDERKGSRRIANELNAEGNRHRGGIWYAQTIQKVLRDPKVAGQVTYDESAYAAKRPASARIDRQRQFAGRHEAIIDPEIWRLAQVLRQNGAARWKVSREDCRAYPLSGLMCCREGHPMRGRSSGNAHNEFNAYYTCGRRARHGLDHPAGCSAPTMQADRAEAGVREVLARILAAPERVVAVVEEANRQLAAAAPGRRAEVEEVEVKIREAQVRVKRLLAVIESEDDRERAGVVLDRIVEVRAEVRDLEARKGDLASNVVVLPKRVSDTEVSAYLAALKEKLASDPQGFAVLLAELRDHHGLVVVVQDNYTVRISLNLDPDRLGGGAHPITLSARARSRVPLVVDGKAGARRMTADEWAELENRKGRLCACGCGAPIVVVARHLPTSKGIPKFLHGHHKMNMMEFVERANREGLLTVSQAAAQLGTSEQTLRRLEERGLIAPERRRWGDRHPMRLYRRDQLPALREALALAGFRFGGDGTLTTAQVAEALGVAENTLRRWERLGLVPAMPRDTRGFRVYTLADLDTIREHAAASSQG